MISIEARKLAVIEFLLSLNDEQLIHKFEALISSKKTIAKEHKIDWWDELPESVKKDHEEGEKDGEEGRVIELDDFLKKYRK